MSQYWFKKRKSLSDIGRPATWQGWAIFMVFVFLIVMVIQLISRWIYYGFQPLASGVWLAAAGFIAIGIYLSLAKRFSPPMDDEA